MKVLSRHKWCSSIYDLKRPLAAGCKMDLGVRREANRQVRGEKQQILGKETAVGMETSGGVQG